MPLQNFVDNSLPTVKAAWLNAVDLLLNNLPTPTGGTNVGFLQSGTGAVAGDVQTELRRTLNVFQFMTPAQIADVQAGTLAVDVRAALQAAINAAISQQKKLMWPVGAYSISGPLFIYKWSGTAFSYVSCDMEGEKGTWYSTVAGIISSATITPTYNDTFGIGIQNGRSIEIKNITLIGKNDVASVIGANLYKTMINATYSVSGRDSRYSPYTGICIDPFGTSVPADGGYPGLSAYYVASAAGSSDTKLTDVCITGFIVACAMTPNGTTSNDENNSFHNCTFIGNKVGLSIGYSQNRCTNWYGGSNVMALYCFDGNTYGAQEGSSPNIYGCNMSGKHLFNIPARWGFVPTISGVHAESFGSIGFIGTGVSSGRQPITLTGCQFTFGNWGGLGYFADHHLLAQTPVLFVGCLFDISNSTVAMPLRMFQFIYLPLTFDNCQFNANSQSPEFWLAVNNGGTFRLNSALYLRNCVVNDGSSTGNAQGIQELSDTLLVYRDTDITRSVIPRGASIVQADVPADIRFANWDEADNTVSVGTVTVTVGAAGAATFTVADGSIVRVGDLIVTNTGVNYEKYDGTTTFSENGSVLGVVTTVATNDITIKGIPQSLVTGSYALYATWWRRYHSAGTGDTHTNTTLDNVSNASSWAIGNKILGTGIVAGTYITNIVGTTFTLSKATTATAAGVRIYDANVYKITGTAV